VGHFAQQPAPTVDSSNAFTDYVRAADEAEKTGGRYLDMVSFYPGQKQKAMDSTSAALAMVVSGTSKKCEFQFSAISPFKAPPHERGWRLIGRDLVWKIQAAIQAGDFAQAVAAANVATKFGFDISGGGATDASLGLAIVNEARQAIAPALDRMDATQLGSLAAGVTRALADRPSVKQTIEHEHENMLMGVQAVQDAYRSERFDDLGKELGPDARGAIEFLQALRGKDATKRPQYFQAFADDADEEVNYMNAVAEMPVAKRTTVAEAKPGKGDRPWKKFSKEFFSSLRPLLQMQDESLARTRLLILEASILQQVKSSGSAPKDLSQFPADLRTDPYSGQSFIYGADGADYHVYSVGADFRDDGGESDETFTIPDLRLEKSS
jgi:hypothetical protein